MLSNFYKSTSLALCLWLCLLPSTIARSTSPQAARANKMNMATNGSYTVFYDVLSSYDIARIYQDIGVEPALGWLWGKVPTHMEVLIDTGWQAPIDVLLGPLTQQLGDNPTAKVFIRDSLKLPSTIHKARENITIGSGPFVYDHMNVWSQTVKGGSKVLGIFLLPKMFGIDKKEAAKFMNYPADYFARVLVKQGHHQQSHNGTAPNTTEFLGISFSAFPEIMAKTYAMTQVGHVIQLLGLAPRIRTLCFSLATGVIPGMQFPLANEAEGKAHTVYKLHKINMEKRSSWLSPIVFSLTLVVTITTSFTEKYLVTMVMTPIARAVMDGVDLALKQGGPFIVQLYNIGSSTAFFYGTNNEDEDEDEDEHDEL